ncbi:MAG: hypothetical protein AAGA21_24930 [Pseudomonadota bacterium]
MTPSTYDEWRHCIVVKCGLQLTPEFIQQRLSALRDENDYQTLRFREMWGVEHLRQVITWFEKAENER